MVIQRWQTVWLLIAAILMGVFCGVPMALVAGDELSTESWTPIMPTDMPVLLVVAIAVAVLYLAAIFMYRNTRRQKLVTLVGMLLTAVTAATECIALYGSRLGEGHVEWLGSIFLLVGAFAFAWLAYRGITSDEKLLRAADRLR